MVRKFLMWKTNKQEHEDFPAYVLHFTDFSPNRKDALAREVRVSDSEQQIHDLWNGLKEANIKRGWNLLESAETAKPLTSADQPAEPATTAAAGKKKAAKKPAGKTKAAKKKTKATSGGAPKKKAAGKMAKSAQAAQEKTAKKTRKKSG